MKYEMKYGMWRGKVYVEGTTHGTSVFYRSEITLVRGCLKSILGLV
jgi:hypothetical protein